MFLHSVPEAILHQDSDSHSDTELHKEDIEDIIANYHIKQDKKLAERLKASIDENQESIKSDQEINQVNDSKSQNNQVCGNRNRDNQVIGYQKQISGNKTHDPGHKNQQDVVICLCDDENPDVSGKLRGNGRESRDGRDKNKVGGKRNQNKINKNDDSGKTGGDIAKDTEYDVVEVEFQPSIGNEKEPHFVEISVGGGKFTIFNILFLKIDTVQLFSKDI